MTKREADAALRASTIMRVRRSSGWLSAQEFALILDSARVLLSGGAADAVAAGTIEGFFRAVTQSEDCSELAELLERVSP